MRPRRPCSARPEPWQSPDLAFCQRGIPMPIARRSGSSSRRTRCARRSNDVITTHLALFGPSGVDQDQLLRHGRCDSVVPNKAALSPPGSFATPSPLRLVSTAVPRALSILRNPVVFTDRNGTVQTYRSADETVPFPPARVRDPSDCIREAGNDEPLVTRVVREGLVGPGNTFPRTLRPFPRDPPVAERGLPCQHVRRPSVRPLAVLRCIAPTRQMKLRRVASGHTLLLR